MGNKISTLGRIKIGENIFDVELNEGTKDEKFDIHIQNEQVKFFFKDKEFARFAVCFIAAKKRFDVLKGKSNEQSCCL